MQAVNSVNALNCINLHIWKSDQKTQATEQQMNKVLDGKKVLAVRKLQMKLILN